MQSLDLGLLVALDALLQEESVTGAARRVGLSTPAMSHALARIRIRLADPILVRAGRTMVLTPRAEALRPRVRALVSDASELLSPARPFSAGDLERTFVVHVTDHVLLVLGKSLDRLVNEEAPGVSLRFVPNTPDDAASLRQGQADLAVGIYGDLPPEMRTRKLLTDRFVCVAREDHPRIGRRLSLETFVDLPHVQVAPRGRPGGYVDDVLRERGLERRVVRAIPYFLTALHLVAETDYVLVVSERIASAMAPRLGLRILEPPLELLPYTLSLVWHPRFDADPAHEWLRNAFLRAAKEVGAEVAAGARSRLDATDPTTGTGLKRRPRRKR